jgi:lysophospholipid acyltransferase (LPLAT)-like uncharacterized protein
VPPDFKKPFRIARRNLGAALLPAFGPSGLRALARTWETELLGEEHLRAAERAPGRLLALWHGRMLVGTPQHAHRDYTVLVSPSDDGGLMDLILRRFGYRVVRGSTSQGGARALRELLGRLREGGTIVLTPDGPRGPRQGMNSGLAWMSSRAGYPVVPVGFACDRAWHLSSWDRFTIPRPHARIATAYGPPLRVPPDAGGAALEEATWEIRARLLAAEERARTHLGLEPEE